MPILVIQQGHCFRTIGATGTVGEQGYAVAVGNACTTLLDGRGGWQVRRILADDPQTAQFYGGDAFVAIHCDGSTSPAAQGASVGYRTPEGQHFGQAFKRAYAARGWTGGFRPDNYTSALAGYYGTGAAVKVGNRRAFIAECGFRTNPEDLALLDGPGGPQRVALAIGDALGIPLGTTPTPPIQEDDMPNLGIQLFAVGADSTDEPIPARDVLALPGPSKDPGSRLWLTTGWGQEIRLRVWFLGEGDHRYLGPGGGDGHEYLIKSDSPGWAPIPSGTVAIHAEWTTADPLIPGDLRVLFVPA